MIRGVLFLLLTSFLLSTTSLGQETPKADEQAVLSWIKQNAIPIRHIEAGNGFADLQPLKEILKDVKIVGLGEARHGTREFFQFKHRFYEFLVKEMGYTVFTLEASYSASLPINDYVLYGKGDLATVLTGQGYSPWDTEEFTEMINWMRSYNQTVPENKKIKFYGLDVPYNRLGREKVISFLQKYAPAKVSSTDSLFNQLVRADEKWPMWGGGYKTEASQVLPRLQELKQYFLNHQNSLISASSTEEFQGIILHVKLMEQLLESYINYSLRAEFMAKNLLYLMDVMPDAKFVVSAHNAHINTVSHKGDQNIGNLLRAKWGKKFYSVGFETNKGSYQTREWLPEQLLVGDFRVGKLGSAPETSLPWYLSQLKMDNLFLDLRVPVKDQLVTHWLNTPQIMRDVSWIYNNDPSALLKKVKLSDNYDGMFFIEKTTRARPTKNALVKASNKAGF